MQKTFLKLSLILFSLSLASCSYKVSRMGYSEQETKPKSNDQKIIFKKMADIDSAAVVRVGRVELNDNGLTVNCQESDAIRQLITEAHQAGGQFVNIVEERRSDINSSCYRCLADIYRFTNDSLYDAQKSDPAFSPQNIQKAEAMDRKRNKKSITAAIIAGVVGGIIGGLFAASL